jgi:hypothetical protein
MVAPLGTSLCYASRPGSADVRGLGNEGLLTEAERSLLNEWLRRLADRST